MAEVVVSADSDGDVGRARQRQEVEGVAGRLRGIRVAADRSDADQLHQGRAQQVGQGDGVVDTGVAVEVERKWRSHVAPEDEVSGRRCPGRVAHPFGYIAR